MENEVMEPKEILAKMNEICRLEFERNWNLSETARVVLNDSNKDCDYVIAKRELQDYLNSVVGEGREVRVNMYGDVTIYEVKKNDDGSKSLREIKVLRSENSRMLPYGYVMGRKMTKKAYKEVIERMK